MISITKKLKDQLWWLIINVDYNYSRITIADHDFTENALTLWLEDKHDFKNTLEECLQIDIKLKDFAAFITTEGLNSYEGTRLHPKKKYVYNTGIQINEPLAWYENDATPNQQTWAREALLKRLLTELIECETKRTDMF